MSNHRLVGHADEDGDGTVEDLEYELKLIQNLDDNGNIPFTGITTNKPENNQQFGFEGKTVDIPIQVMLYNHDEDMSNGTYNSLDKTDARIEGSTIGVANSNVETIEEQIIWLKQYVHNSIFGTDWRLYGGRFTDPDGDGTEEGTPVAVEDVKISQTAEQPTRAMADIKLKVGQVI